MKETDKQEIINAVVATIKVTVNGKIDRLSEKVDNHIREVQPLLSFLEGANKNSPYASGGNGGSGVVIIRFATASITVTDSTNASSSTSGSDTILTWNSSGSSQFTLATANTSLGFFNLI